MGPAIAALLRAGVAKLAGKGVKEASSYYAKKGPVDKLSKATGKISKARVKGAKRTNELKNPDKNDSPTYSKMMKKGVKKQSERTEMLKRSKKPGMSKGYKQRKQWNLRLSNMKRQMAKQGYNKKLGQEIGELQQQIDKSYK